SSNLGNVLSLIINNNSKDGRRRQIGDDLHFAVLWTSTYGPNKEAINNLTKFALIRNNGADVRRKFVFDRHLALLCVTQDHGAQFPQHLAYWKLLEKQFSLP